MTRIESDSFLAARHGARHEALAELSSRGTVHRLSLPTGRDAWVITGYNEARALLTDPRVVKGQAPSAPFSEKLPQPLYRALSSHMLGTDPPHHTRLRRLVSAAFTRQRVEALAPRIELTCAELLDDLEATLDREGQSDLIAAYAAPLPITVICELLGIPRESHGDMRVWSEPLLAGRFAGYEGFLQAAEEIVEFLHGVLADKRRAPQDDLLSALVEARDGQDRLSEDELTSMVYLLLLAGHETTVHLIANGMNVLFDHPDVMALLRAEPERLPGAIEELLRFDGPAQTSIPAMTAEPIELAGHEIPAGEHIMVSLMAANRDPSKFDEPQMLNLTRKESHLGFGHGVHHCLGAPLARLETRIALRELLSRFDDLERAVPLTSLQRTPSLLVNRLSDLPVRRAA